MAALARLLPVVRAGLRHQDACPAQWLLDSTAGRGTVQTGVQQGPGTRYVRYRAGDRVFEEGNRADGFYAVVEGAFELEVRDANGRTTLRRIGPGGHFGERVLLGEGLRTGTVRALEDSVVLVVGAEDFKRLTKTLPPLRAYFDRYVSEAFQPTLSDAG
jgi:NADH dehydrogenase